MRIRPLLLALLLLAHTACAGEPTVVVGAAKVVDGDTVHVQGTKVRLYGIDTPETAQPCTDAQGAEYACGISAKDALSARIDGRPVRCVGKDTDVFGRLVAVCSIGDDDLNAAMVRAGWALAFRKYSEDYVALEDEARAGKVGLWAGTFTAPWEWRADGRAARSSRTAREPSPAPDPACPIKGNISRGGSRIYHLPGSGGYDGTRIDLAKGERWFCTEAEAKAAGWRAPKG